MVKKAKENRIVVGIARQIILEGVSNQIAFNIMDLEDSKEMWDKLTSICTEIGQRVIYSIFWELLNYPKINKSKEYDKPIMQIFAEVRYLCKRLQTAMTPGQDLRDIIAIVIALDTLHDNFNTTTTSLLESENKTIDQIQSILQWKEAKNISKRATKVKEDLAMAFKDSNSPKKKAYRDEKCFNYHKHGHFGHDCRQPDRRLARIGGPSTREHTNNRSGS